MVLDRAALVVAAVRQPRRDVDQLALNCLMLVVSEAHASRPGQDHIEEINVMRVQWRPSTRLDPTSEDDRAFRARGNDGPIVGEGHKGVVLGDPSYIGHVSERSMWGMGVCLVS